MAAKQGADGEKLLEQTVHVDYAFVRQETKNAGGRAGKKGGRQRSRSPGDRRKGDEEDGEVE